MFLSGDLGSGKNTLSFFKWILSGITTTQNINLIHFLFRQTLHILCYGILSVLWFRALMAAYPKRLGINIILALALCLMVALIDEVHQIVVTSRKGSLRDVGLDMTGAVLFTFLAALFWKKRVMAPSEAQSPVP
jgi:VanZ family protein